MISIILLIKYPGKVSRFYLILFFVYRFQVLWGDETEEHIKYNKAISIKIDFLDNGLQLLFVEVLV